jgi:hypothetical protein
MKKFNLNSKFINENAILANQKINEIFIRVNELKKVVDFSTENNNNLLSEMFDEDIKDVLEDLNENLNLLNELVYKP